MKNVTAYDGYRISIKGNAEFYVKVDGQKFNYKKDFISAGEHTVEVCNRIYLIEWYAIFIVILDFLLSLFAGDFGEIFIKQGAVKYSATLKGNIDYDNLIEFNKDAPPQILSGDLQIVDYNVKQLPRIEKALKKYGFICRIISLIFLIVFIAVIASMIAISNI